MKLKWFSGEWGKYDENKEDIIMNEVVKALPGKDQYRKGAIYPHPLNPSKAYLKVYQEDKDSVYFDTFLEGAQRPAARQMLNEMKRIGRLIKKKPLSLEEVIGIHSGLVAHVGTVDKMVDTSDVVRMVGDALPSLKPQVKKKVNDFLRIRGIIKHREVNALKLRFKVGNITVYGRIKDINAQFKTQRNNPRVHTLKGEISSIEVKK